MSRDQAFRDTVRALGYSFDGEIKRGGNYLPLVRVGDTVVATGRAGLDVTLAQAQLAARICAMRALALLQRAFGSLEKIGALPKVNVYVQCADGFTQQSEAADAASELLLAILGADGAHARTSVGAFQLPKNAAVELDLVAVAHAD